MSEPALSPLAAVRLVAGRELSTRIRSKAFLVGTLVMVILVVALSLGVKLLNHSSTTTVGLTPSSASLSSSVVSSAKSIGSTVKTRVVADQATGEREVRSGKLDALITDDNGQIQAI